MARKSLAFVTTLLIWSSMPLVMKWTVEVYSPISAFYLRLLIALLVVFIIRVATDTPSLNFNRHWRIYFWASIGICPSGPLAYWSSQYLPSGVYAIIYGLMPLFVLLLSMLIEGTQSLKKHQWLALAISFAGLTWLSGSQLHSGNITSKGLVTGILSALIFALSVVKTSKHSDSTLSVLNVINGSLLMGMISMTPLIPLLDVGPMIEADARYFIGVLYLGGVGSVLSYISYYYLINHVSAVTVSTLFVATPVMAVLVGTFLNFELYSVKDWIGIGGVILGLSFYFRTRH